MTHRITAKFRNFFTRKVRPSLCEDCKHKMDRKFGLMGKIRQNIKYRKGRKLRGAAKTAFLRRMAEGKRKHRR